jgi:protein-S-isoprenylcysteine O-methyltransferase Ste14
MTFGLRSFHATADPTVGGVVEGGPYRWIRHPIYAAILLFVWAGVGSHPSVVSVAAGLIASIATAVRMRTEETLLVTRYPAYAAYAARTKRVVPFIL